MLIINNFIRFPSILKNREKLIDKVQFVNLEKLNTEYGFEIISATQKYKQIIQIYDKLINFKSPIKVVCTCQSFKFEFCNAIFKAGSLVDFSELEKLKINPDEFSASIVIRPKGKNIFNTISGCKHIIKLCRESLKFKT